MVFLQDVHYKIFYILIFLFKHVKKAKLCAVYDRLDKKIFSIVQKYEYDVKVSRTRTFVRGQRRTKVRPCGRTLTTDTVKPYREPSN